VNEPIEPERAGGDESSEKQTFRQLTGPARTGAASATFFDEQAQPGKHREAVGEKNDAESILILA
jgi:hypothetical protein